MHSWLHNHKKFVSKCLRPPKFEWNCLGLGNGAETCEGERPRRELLSRGTSCHQMLPEHLSEQGLYSLGICFGEKPAMPVIRVIKGRVSGF